MLSRCLRLLPLISILFSHSAWAEPVPIPEDQRCKVWGKNPNDGAKALDMFTTWVTENFTHVDKNNADFLWRDITEWNTPRCVTENGMPRLAVLLPGLNASFKKEEDWSKSLQRVTILKQKFPKADFLGIVEAQYWLSYAWQARGGGYASTVSENDWKLFSERLRKAERILIDSKPIASNLPNWYELMIEIEALLTSTSSNRYLAFKEGTERYASYYPIYAKMIRFSAPKWGGSWEEVDKVVTWSVDHTKAQQGNAMYARLYMTVNNDLPKGESLLKSTKAKWNKMNEGFQDLLKQYPSNWNLNIYAKYACMAGDKDTYIGLRKKIGSAIYNEVWEWQISIEVCDQLNDYPS